ncbi:MAG: LL-diaminopimelate aminotransferase, partial [Planctomycetes bacterium]|nr:LL-diaminopimelate aminotransferase [Planctomycetota bacterium]
EGCESAGLTAYGGVHSPYVWVVCPEGIDSWGVFDHLLNDAQLVTTPGVGFGSCGEGYFRISAFNTRENTEAAVERLRNVSW